MPQTELHQQVAGHAPAMEDHDFVLTTDGSGTDKTRIGTGSAWVLRPMACQVPWEAMRGCCGSSFGSIQRAEFMALLEGLRALASYMKLEDIYAIRAYSEQVNGHRPETIDQLRPECRARVWWIGDRENLVLQTARKPDSSPFYGRRTEPDLWHALYWYEHLFRITATYQERNTSEDQKWVDKVAGETRAKFLT